jgi:putative Mg2+ transporter-C (MgtC) family protein
MTLYLSWQQIALRIALACIASLAIGGNRDEHGRPAGLRTVMLVTLTATLAMLQVNLLLPLAGKSPTSFNVLDLMRLPLGILSGIGFIGAGAIIKKESGAMGVTTAATLWFSTMLGLLFGGGQILLGSASAVLALLILTALKHVEGFLPRMNRGTLTLNFGEDAPEEDTIRAQIRDIPCDIKTWAVQYLPSSSISSSSISSSSISLIRCELQWKAVARKGTEAPPALSQLRTKPGVTGFYWEQ